MAHLIYQDVRSAGFGWLQGIRAVVLGLLLVSSLHLTAQDKRNSVLPLASTPVKRVRTREVASCASGERLFGPW